MKLVIDPSERWIFVGKTGSGKSELAKYLLRIVAEKMPVVIIDPKFFWLGRYPEWETNKKKPGTIDKPHLISEFNPKWRVQCLQPDTEDEEDNRLEKLCYTCLERGNIFLYFDETAGIATAHRVPKYISKIWQMGRAKDVGAWVSTQAPSGIPRIFKSQAEHFVGMKVGVQDVDVVAQLLNAEEEEVKALQPYEWLYYHTKLDFPELQAPIPLKEKK